MFWVNPKHIAIQMFLEFLWRHNLSKQHAKHIPKSENMFVVFLFLSFFFFFFFVCTFQHILLFAQQHWLLVFNKGGDAGAL